MTQGGVPVGLSGFADRFLQSLATASTVPVRPFRRNIPLINSVFDSFGWGKGDDTPGWSEWYSSSIGARRRGTGPFVAHRP